MFLNDYEKFYKIEGSNIGLEHSSDMYSLLNTLQEVKGVLGANDGSQNAFIVGLDDKNFDKHKNIEVVLGIGASVNNPSYAFGAYLITLLDAISKLKNQGFINTTGRIVFPTFFSALINNMDQNIALEIQKKP